jgi:hypothetical protein
VSSDPSLKLGSEVTIYVYTVLQNAWHKILAFNLFAICVIRKILDSQINFWQMQFAQIISQFA